MSKEIQNKDQAEEAIMPLRAAETSAVNVIEKFLAAGDVEAVYGQPVMHGEVMIIPSAEILSGGGFGIGSGGDPAGGGSGGGGGGRVLSRPVAVIISGPDGVRVEPVVDATKIVLAFFTAIGFMASMAARMKRGNKS